MKLFNNAWNYIIINRKRVTVGKNCKVSGRLFVHGKKNGIKIGDNVIIHSNPIVNPTSGFQHCYLRSEGKGKIVIGNNVGMSHVNITSFNSITIEDNVLIGSGVKIWDTDFHAIEYNDRCKNVNIKSAPIFIKEGAFIGACSIILKGVTIGKHSVIGAGSVVTKNIPDNEIWGGNPARFIKKLDV